MIYPNGNDFEYRLLKPSQIKVDMTYQRELDQRRVEKIAKEFNGNVFNEPKVSYRDGSYWVFNGQHSIGAWKVIHNMKDTPVLCKVYRGMTWLDECNAFCEQNGISKDPSVNDKLRAGYNSHDPDVRKMVEAAELCGFVVDFKTSKIPTRIVATAMLSKAYRTLGYDAYLDMLTAIKEAWYGDVEAISRPVLSGMTEFYKTYWPRLSRDVLVKKMRVIKPIDIIRNGRNVSTGNGYAKEIWKAYNVRLKANKLPDEL